MGLLLKQNGAVLLIDVARACILGNADGALISTHSLVPIRKPTHGSSLYKTVARKQRAIIDSTAGFSRGFFLVWTW
jgi:hypothetical protein